MTYYELILDAVHKLNSNQITSGEYDDMIEPLKREIEQQPCEDCISRAAVLAQKQLVELEDGQSFYCISPEDVKTLPSVTPKKESGKR